MLTRHAATLFVAMLLRFIYADIWRRDAAATTLSVIRRYYAGRHYMLLYAAAFATIYTAPITLLRVIRYALTGARYYADIATLSRYMLCYVDIFFFAPENIY